MTAYCRLILMKKNFEISAENDEVQTASEWFWFSVSVALFFISIACAVFAFSWIWSAETTNEAAKRATISTPIGAAFVAAITFTTVVWRGLVSARQANEHQRTNDAKDDENTARLMLDGAKMIGDAKDSSVVAGIAALELVIKTEDSQFSQTAMDVLADFIVEKINSEKRDTLVQQARASVEKGVILGLSSDRTISIDYSVSGYSQKLRAFNGFEQVHYLSGELSPSEFSMINDIEKCTFRNTQINSLKDLGVTNILTRCKFVNCSFSFIQMADQEGHVFSTCDLSNVEFTFSNPLPPEELQDIQDCYFNCFYFVDAPPFGNGINDILPYLEPRDRPAT